MFVKDLMTSPAITVPARTTVKEGLRLLDEHRVTSLPVIDDRGHIMGIVSEADLLRHAVRHDARTHMIPPKPEEGPPRSVEDAMSTRSITVTGDCDISDAVELMISTAVKSLPVVEMGRVVGVISRSDVVHLLARSDALIRDEIDELLRSAGVVCEVFVEGGFVRIESIQDPGHRRFAEVIAGSVDGVMSVQIPR